MNWVGGTRNRLVMKNDAKKQKEFFERRKMQQKLKNLGIALPASPRGTTSGSMDLVTLFIVNQIAAKKENKDPPKVAVLGSYKGASKYKRNETLVLPMSPCSPSQLDLVESQSQFSIGTRKGKNVVPQGFKSRQLSPVLESAFSDNSASDYLPPTTDPRSPFSSNSAASSVNLGRSAMVSPGMFSLQQGNKTQTQLPLHYSSPPWDTSTLEQTKPFSQARGMMDSTPLSNRSNPPLYQLETPTAAQALFGSPENYITEVNDHAEHQVTFTLNQPKDTEPVLDFTLHRAEMEQQFQEDVFRGFSTEECGGEVSHVGRGKSKIYLRDETPDTSSTPQTVPDSPGMEVELSNCTGMNCSRLQHNYGPMSCCDKSPSSPCAKGYLSSDSEDDQRCYHSCPSAISSYMDQICCEVSHSSNLGLQDNGQQSHIQPRLPTPSLKSQMNLIDNQEVIEYMAGSDEGVGSNRQQTGRSTDPFESELCKCEKTSNESQDVGTQTDDKPMAETCDASTQCSFVLHSASKAPAFNLCLPPFDLSVKHPATRRQTNTTSEPNTQAASTGNGGNGGKHMPWNKKISRASSLLENKITNKFPAINSDGKGIPQRPINPFLDVLSMTDGKGEEKREGKDERGQEENGRLMKDPSNEVREEVTCATKVNRLSEETETLEEIADILLLLKQRKDE